jgi:hypothetical protein
MSSPARKVTNDFLEAVEHGCFDNYELIVGFCKYLSEDEVIDFLEANELMTIVRPSCEI